MRGLIHLYTGNGNGKTTAAMGLALRYAGHGKKVVIVQFLKGRETGEIKALAAIPEVTVLRNTRDYGFWKTMSITDRKACRTENTSNLAIAASIAAQGSCDLLILDELTSAYENDAVDRAAAESIITEKPAGLELVITGRSAPGFMLQAADYLTEVRSLRHPFDNGIPAREGAEY